MAKVSKATKKFQTKKLDGVLKKRKEHKKAAQKFKTKKPANGTAPGASEGEVAPKAKGERNGDLFDSMNVDDFLAGGFEVGTKPQAKKQRQITKKAEPTESAESGSEDGVSASEVDGEEQGAASSHKDQLKDLSKTDPVFYKFLQDNDADLLNFDGAEEEDLVFSDDEDEAEITSTTKAKTRTGPEPLTLKDVQKWEQQLSENSLRCVRKIVLAFRAAAHLNEENDKTYRYAIEDPEVFQRITVLAVTGIPKFLETYVPIKKHASGKPKIPTGNKKFVKLIPLLKSHFATLLHFLQGLTDAVVQKQVLDSSMPLVGYMLTFRQFLRIYMKAVLDIWSTCQSDTTRISAFLLIREFLTMGDAGLRETGLKVVYSSFVRESRTVNLHTMPLINLMKNSASELFGLDHSVSYQLIFGFLRQLAIVLRKSINEKSKDSYKTVYNWQFIHSLDFWSRTLSQHAADPASSLRPLIYPLVQVSLGVAKLVPTSQFFPLRFHIIRSLIRLSVATTTFIPLAPIIFDVLEATDMKRKPVASTAAPMNFDLAIRAKQEHLRTKVYQDQVGDVAVELLLDYYAAHANSIAFPELSIPATVQIKRYMKRTKNAKLGRALGAVVERLGANAKFIERAREHVAFTPRDLTQLDQFSRNMNTDQTPLGAYVKVQRAMRDESRAAIAASEARAQGARSKKQGAARADIEEDLESNSSSGGDSDQDMD